jgi:hypothetical protein
MSPHPKLGKWLTFGALEKSMSTEVYAAALVKHLDSSTPKPWFWKGTNSTVTWVVSTFMPKGGFVSRAMPPK